MAIIKIESSDGTFVWEKEFTGEDIYYMQKESYGLLDALNKAADIDERESNA